MQPHLADMVPSCIVLRHGCGIQRRSFIAVSQFHLTSAAQELEEGVAKVKDLAANTQDEVKMAELADDLKRRIAARGEFSLIAAGAAAQAVTA